MKTFQLDLFATGRWKNIFWPHNQHYLLNSLPKSLRDLVKFSNCENVVHDLFIRI